MTEQDTTPSTTFADVFGNEITISSHMLSVMEAKVKDYLDTHEGAW